MARKHGFFRPHLGRGFPQAASTTMREGGGLPLYFADFVNGVYQVNRAPSTLGAATDYTRSGTAYADNVAGTWSSFGANAERITDRGILIEPSRQNVLRNNNGTGASAPSTLPTNWSSFVGGALTLAVDSVNTVNGLTIPRFRLSGTANATTGLILRFETTTGIAALTGETFTLGAWMRIHAGSTANITVIRLKQAELTAAGATIKTQDGPDIKASLSSTLTLFESPELLDGGGTTAYMRPFLAIDYNNGAVVDITFDLMPQVEKAATNTSPIPTSSAAVTRAADALVLKLPGSETHDMLVTFDNDTTQTIADVTGGDYSVPTNLDRPRVKSFDWGSV